jgi:hypothetical protein
LAPVLICSLLLTGCSLFGEEDSFGSDGVKATVQDETIVINNRRGEPIWVRTVGVSVLPTILLVPPDLDGKSIPPGEKRAVEFEEITMGEDEEALSVSWWSATMKNGEHRAGEVSSFRVEL